VAVAAGDGHAGLREPELRTDDVDDALAAAGGVEQRDPRLGAVVLERHQHLLRQRVRQRAPLRGGGDDVVHGGEGARRDSHPEPHLAQHGEGLGAGDLVDQMQADEELGLAAGQLGHGVRVPDLVEQVPSRRAHGRPE
jgi:hypothetical protein